MDTILEEQERDTLTPAPVCCTGIGRCLHVLFSHRDDLRLAGVRANATGVIPAVTRCHNLGGVGLCFPHPPQKRPWNETGHHTRCDCKQRRCSYEGEQSSFGTKGDACHKNDGDKRNTDLPAQPRGTCPHQFEHSSLLSEDGESSLAHLRSAGLDLASSWGTASTGLIASCVTHSSSVSAR